MPTFFLHIVLRTTTTSVDVPLVVRERQFEKRGFSVSIISGIEIFFASEGYVTIFDFLSKFLCLTVPKMFAGEPFCAVFQKISGSEKVYG